MTLSNSGESNTDILIEQVGRLTEGLTEFKTEMLVRFDQLTQIAERQASAIERQERNIERQERNIDRLVGIVEALIQRDRT